eukprot:g9773.t1
MNSKRRRSPAPEEGKETADAYEPLLSRRSVPHQSSCDSSACSKSDSATIFSWKELYPILQIQEAVKTALYAKNPRTSNSSEQHFTPTCRKSVKEKGTKL